MDQKRTPKPSIVIPLPSKPPPYRPGDGPLLAPIGIVLEHDSDAFIVDKRVLPSTTRDGKLKLQMYYVVGWPDLPAARITVLATEVHDYVSPRVVEDFEYRDLLERDEEIERREAEKRRKAQIAAEKRMAKYTNAAGTSAIPEAPTSLGQKKRGRPSKAQLQARRLARQTGIDNSQCTKATLPSTNTSGPSLSTPQKKRARETPTDIEEDEEADLDDAILNQLYGDNTAGEADVEDMDIDDSQEDGDIPGLEIRSYARTLWLNKDSTLVNRANGSLAPKSSTSHVPVPEVLRSNKQFHRPPKQPGGRPRTTPVPVPRPFNHDEKKPTSLIPDRRQSTTHVPVPTPFGVGKELSRPKAPDIGQSMTPVPVPSWSRLKAPKGARSTPILPPEPPEFSAKHHGFTPAGRSSAQWPAEPRRSRRNTPARSSVAPSQSDHEERERSSRPKKKTPKPKPETEPQQEEQVWEVKRLEGDKIIDVDGAPERYFKVRWEGNWPRDQNPTWEPEDNIPPGLVKQYLKKKAARRKTASPGSSSAANTPSKASSRHPLTLKRKYSSVAEAFAGDEDELGDSAAERNEDRRADGGSGDRYGTNDDDYVDDDDDVEMLVVEPSPSARGSKRVSRAEKLGAAFMRDLAAAIYPANVEQRP
ncbi:hypothetical protein GGS26DRAFT_223325 [Hypomontagnella submonticulosa]|nr:hypothetical protein GGS26DRAFT_223325 [Hypomontagnella submonticulosa]